MRRQAVRRYMTGSPVVIAPGASLAEAHDVMRARRIRHLPVVREGALVGVVSQRDVYLVETLRGVDPAVACVEEAMSPDPYAVSPEAPLHEVALEMARRRIGSAVVVSRGAVIGLFTTVDALGALGALARGDSGTGGRRGAGDEAI